MQSYSDNPNGNVSLTVENVWSIILFIKMFLFCDCRIEITFKNQSNFQITVVLKITFTQF